MYIGGMDEMFPHYYEDGYLITNRATTGWPIVQYGGIYRDTNGFPYQWNTYYKRSKPIAHFVSSAWRGKKIEPKKCWYGCDLIYKYSVN